MNENLFKSTDSLKTSVRAMRSKFLTLRTDLDTVLLEFDKMLDKFDKIEREASTFYDKTLRQYDRRFRLAEKEMRLKTLRDIRNNANLLDEELEVNFNSKDVLIATTASIIEVFIHIISGGNDGFKLMSQSIVFPCIYENLMGEDWEDYVLRKIPSHGEQLADLGREYAKSIIDECPFQLSSERAWASYGSKVGEWWRDSMLPGIYGDACPVLDAEQLDYRDIKKWHNEPETHTRNFAEVYDVMCHLRTHKQDIESKIGVSELIATFHHRPEGLLFN